MWCHHLHLEKEKLLRNLYEELRESDNSPEKGEKNNISPICGAPEVHRSVRTKAATKGTIKSKHKPVILVTVHAPRMRDVNKRSAPSTNISVKLPFQSAEGGKEGNN